MTRSQIIAVILGVVVVLVWMSTFVINERELAVKFRLGEIVKSDFEPGLYFITPFVNNVRKFDARVQGLDAPPERYLTSEKKNVIVDAFIKWRIVDVAQFYRATSGDMRSANDRLSRIANNALKNQVSQRTIKQVISGERTEIMNKVQEGVAEEAKQFGSTIVDVRIKKLDYPETISRSVYQRMEKERATVAKQLRSEGEERATVIRSQAERKREEILAEAFRTAEEIRGEGDAEAAEVYAQAFDQNREFYQFTRSLNAYRETFSSGDDVMVIKPDSEFFRYFNEAGGGQ